MPQEQTKPQAKEVIKKASNLPTQINLEDYLIPEIPTPPLPQTVANANPNPEVIQTAQLQQPNVTQQGLTPIEQSLLSPEEQLIRLRQRGLIT